MNFPERSASLPPLPTTPRLYLFFNCEGWMRFGPFEFIQFDESGKIIDEKGEVLAIQVGNEWRATEKLGQGFMNLRNLIISPKPNLPPEVRNRGSGLASL